MEINTNLKLQNGLEANFAIINTIDVIINETINVTLHYFKTKDHFNKAFKQIKLLKAQDDLVTKLNELQLTDFNEDEAEKLHNKINELANELDSLPNYNDFIIKSESYSLPYVENYDFNYILTNLNMKGE